MDRPRRTALEALRDIDRSGAYANIATSRVIEDQELTGRDAAFVSELVFGTCRMVGSYDEVIEAAGHRQLETMQPDLVNVLRLGAHQLLGMRVPTRAAVDTTVDLAGVVLGEKVTGIANAIMRAIATKTPDEWWHSLSGGDESRLMELSTGHPRWIVDAYRSVLPDDELMAALNADNVAAEPTLVVRPGLCKRQELIDAGATPTKWSPWGATRSGKPGDLSAVRTGRAGVQDEGSQLVCLAASRIDGLTGGNWLDLCAGPGGKSALLAGIGADHGAFLVANEAQPHRARLVGQALRRYRTNRYQVVCADGTEPAWDPESFHLVLADVPCSGLGALRRRPEARWRRIPADIDDLVPLQEHLLATALDSCEPGGFVVYVTCSPHPHETAQIVERFRDEVEIIDAPALIPEVPDAAAASDPRFIQLWPHRHGTDAMFAAILRKP